MTDHIRPKCLGQLSDDNHEIEIWIGTSDEINIVDLKHRVDILIPEELFEQMLSMIQAQIKKENEIALNNLRGSK